MSDIAKRLRAYPDDPAVVITRSFIEEIAAHIERVEGGLAVANAVLHGTTGEVSTKGVLEELAEFRLAWTKAAAGLAAEREKMGVSVTVGGGLEVFGSMDAIHRVQQYILLDSHHPVEREDVRRSLARALQKAEAELAAERERHEAFKRNAALITGKLMVENTNLREALEPFAAQATERDEYTSGRVEITVPIPALRRARAALSETKGDGDE